MEGEAVEIFALTVQIPPTQGSANGSLKQILITKQIEPLRYRHLNFDALIRHQVQALGFASFCQEKEESPSAASRGKAAQREKFSAGVDTSR